jgi:aspartate racemase
MGGHFCVNELIPISPLPVLNAIPEVAAEIGRRGLKRIGIMGTRTVMESRLYGSLTSVDAVVPEGDALDQVHTAYVTMATAGRVSDAQRQTFLEQGRKLCRERGAEAIMLGGTDLFLAFEGIDPGFPLVDCADIHVDAIYRTSSG